MTSYTEEDIAIEIVHQPYAAPKLVDTKIVVSAPNKRVFKEWFALRYMFHKDLQRAKHFGTFAAVVDKRLQSNSEFERYEDFDEYVAYLCSIIQPADVSEPTIQCIDGSYQLLFPRNEKLFAVYYILFQTLCDHASEYDVAQHVVGYAKKAIESSFIF